MTIYYTGDEVPETREYYRSGYEGDESYKNLHPTPPEKIVLQKWEHFPLLPNIKSIWQDTNPRKENPPFSM